MSSDKFHLPALFAVCVITLLPLPVTAGPPRSVRQGTGVTEAILKSLMYDAEMPYFRPETTEPAGRLPQITLDRTREDAGVNYGFVNSIRSRWSSNDAQFGLGIVVEVYESARLASRAAERALVTTSARQVPMQTEERIGDSSWRTAGPRSGYRMFVLGRTRVIVNLERGRQGRDPKPDDADKLALSGRESQVAEGLARGLEWRIRQRTELLGSVVDTERRDIHTASRVTPEAYSLTYGGITWAPLSAFRESGAKLEWHTNHRVAVSYRGRRLELQPLFRHAILDGEKIDLGAEVLVGEDGLVVPLARVAQALGMKVELTPQTLRLG